MKLKRVADSNRIESIEVLRVNRRVDGSIHVTGGWGGGCGCGVLVTAGDSWVCAQYTPRLKWTFVDMTDCSLICPPAQTNKKCSESPRFWLLFVRRLCSPKPLQIPIHSRSSVLQSSFNPTLRSSPSSASAIAKRWSTESTRSHRLHKH